MKSRTTVFIEEELWKKLRTRAIEEDKSASKLLEEIIKKAIE